MVLAACGGSGDQADARPVPAATYVRGVCQALAQWETGVEAEFAEFGRALDFSERADVIRAGFIDLFEGLDRRLSTAIGRIDEVGTPDVAQGAELAEDLRDVLGESGAVFRETRSKSADLPRTGLEPAIQIEAMLTVVVDQNKRVLGSLDEVANRYGAGQLTQAKSAEPTCSTLDPDL